MDGCGREMVLSLSPGPALLSEAGHLCANANMWRMTGDFWDSWPQLYAMFERCHAWSPYVRPGCWPDCDMLPVGHIGINTPGHNLYERFTNFSQAEQRAMMSLWCIFRSPLMAGAELRDNDAFTLELLTNPEILEMHRSGHGARQVYRQGDTVIWTSLAEDGAVYAAFFNTSFSEAVPDVPLSLLGLMGPAEGRDLWRHAPAGPYGQRVSVSVEPHGAVVLKLYGQGR